MTSSLDGIRGKIAETEGMIKSRKEQLTRLRLPPYAQNLELSSLQQRLEDLTRELKNAENLLDKEELVVTLHPPGLPSGQIPVRTLSLILGGLQSLSDSIANTLYNQPSVLGRIPQEILEQNSLILKEVKAGSFQVTLEAKHNEQLAVDEPPQSVTINELFTLFDVADAADSLIEKISNLGGRTRRNYLEWTKDLRELNTPFELEWKSSIKGQSKVSFDADKATRIFAVLNEISESVEDVVELYGRLTGANVRTKNFELCTPDGSKITGRITQDAIPIVAKIVLDSRCKATLLKVITSYGNTGREKTSWTLKGIQENDYE